jgi:MarR family
MHSAAMLVLRQLGYDAHQSGTSLSVLALLEPEDPTRISALAAAAGLSPPAMTGLVSRLHQDGWSNGSVTHTTAAQRWSISPPVVANDAPRRSAPFEIV